MLKTVNGDMVYIKSKIEMTSPSTDWELSWSRVIVKGLSGEVASFLWKLVHNILPTEERVGRIYQRPTICKFCSVPAVGSIQHCLFECIKTESVAKKVVNVVKSYVPDITPAKLLLLDYENQENLEQPLLWFIANSLLLMWNVRQDGNTVDLTLIRSYLESKISLLRETRHVNLATLGSIIVSILI